MDDVAQVKAAIPRTLKRKAFATFALQEEKFNRWLRRKLEQFVHESDIQESEDEKGHNDTPQYTTTPERAAPSA